jgi:hypothetical protein
MEIGVLETTMPRRNPDQGAARFGGRSGLDPRNYEDDFRREQRDRRFDFSSPPPSGRGGRAPESMATPPAGGYDGGTVPPNHTRMAPDRETDSGAELRDLREQLRRLTEQVDRLQRENGQSNP